MNHSNGRNWNWWILILFFIVFPISMTILIFHFDRIRLTNYIFFGLKHLAEGDLLQFISAAGSSDLAYQAKAAYDFVQDGKITDWVLNLWPPGLPLLFTAAIKLFGTRYFVIKFFIFSFEFLSFALFMLYLRLRKNGIRSFSALIISILPMTFLTFWELTFLNYGYFTSDYYCFVFLIILTVLLTDIDLLRTKTCVQISIALAALAYLRSYYFNLIKFGTIFSVFILLYFLVHGIFNNWNLKSWILFFRRKSSSSALLILAATWWGCPKVS